MQLIDFNPFEQNQRMYGGTAGRKMGIVYDGKNYIIKYPGNLKEKQMKNINLSYSNSPICEYIGSQIYGLLGFQVHNTLLGFRSGKTVVACEDFLNDGDKLYEFDKIKVTFDPPFLDSNGNETNGTGLDLYETLMTIRKHPIFRDLDGVEKHFWNMFVVDALIGNVDRNNSNWGIIIRSNGTKELAPIYDNGNCLNPKWDEGKMQSVLSDRKALVTESFAGRTCVFELNGKRINPYHLIEEMQYDACNNAVKDITPRIKQEWSNIENLISEIPALSDIQKNFYLTIMKSRYENVLQPTYTKIIERDTTRKQRQKSNLERDDR